jgi:uncharacterized damage-inducible protein DinB
MKENLEIAHRFRELFLSGTWIAQTNFKDQLTGTRWELATTRVGELNTLSALTLHVHYYIAGLIRVFEGGPLDIKDQYSYQFPPLTSQEDWEKILTLLWTDVEKFALLVEEFPAGRLGQDFVNPQYGTYQRNIEAMIEHGYYHLGQVVLIKKILQHKVT